MKILKTTGALAIVAFGLALGSAANATTVSATLVSLRCVPAPAPVLPHWT